MKPGLDSSHTHNTYTRRDMHKQRQRHRVRKRERERITNLPRNVPAVASQSCSLLSGFLGVSLKQDRSSVLGFRETRN